MSFAGWITLITTVVITGISGMILYDRPQKIIQFGNGGYMELRAISCGALKF